VHFGRFYKVTGLDHRCHRFPVGEVVVLAVALTGSGASCGMRHRETKVVGVPEVAYVRINKDGRGC
jgi:hypothetical protein